jgi:hypothetical protein
MTGCPKRDPPPSAGATSVSHRHANLAHGLRFALATDVEGALTRTQFLARAHRPVDMEVSRSGRHTRCVPAYPDLPRLPNGRVDYEAVLADPEIEELIWANAVPFWDVADPDGQLRRSFRESAQLAADRRSADQPGDAS